MFFINLKSMGHNQKVIQTEKEFLLPLKLAAPDPDRYTEKSDASLKNDEEYSSSLASENHQNVQNCHLKKAEERYRYFAQNKTV